MFDSEANRPVYKDKTLTFLTPADVKAFNYFIGNSDKSLTQEQKEAVQLCFQRANENFLTVICFKGRLLDWESREAFAWAIVHFYTDLYGIVHNLAATLIGEFISAKLELQSSSKISSELLKLGARATQKTVAENIISIIKRSNGLLQPLTHPSMPFFRTHFTERKK